MATQADALIKEINAVLARHGYFKVSEITFYNTYLGDETITLKNCPIHKD